MITQLAQAIKLTPPKRVHLWLPLAFFTVTASLMIAIVFLVLGYQLFFLQRAYPGVTVSGLDVGGLNRAEIMTLITEKTQPYLNRPVTIRADQESWTFTGQALGLEVDAGATADLALGIGRNGDFSTDVLTHLLLLFHPKNVEPLIRYNSGPTNQILQELSDTYDYPPQDARLVINPEGVVEITPSQSGRRLHLGATQPLIEQAVFCSGEQHLNAFTQEILPTITTEEVAAVQRQATAFLSQPLVFRLDDGETEAREWQIAVDKLVPLVNVIEEVDDAGKTRIQLELNHEALAAYVDELEQSINREPVDAELAFDDEKNELQVLKASEKGRRLDVDMTHTRAEEALVHSRNVIPLPVEHIPATISSDDLESLGIESLISESTSYFKGSSEGRMRNIELAASKFNGVIIAPDEIFSFNDNLGPVTKEEGYDESLIIFGNRTTVGIGGGVCQVSTTAFRTAFFGGLELLERWAHGYRVSWYETNSEPGLDATIYTPDVDLRFRNDTGHFLLIQTKTDLEAGTVTFKFYGTPTDREVTVSKPVVTNVTRPEPPLYEEVSTLPPGTIKQVDWAVDGMDVTVTRVVTEGNKTLHRDEIVSRYRPWRAVYQVGPDTRIRENRVRRE